MADEPLLEERQDDSEEPAAYVGIIELDEATLVPPPAAIGLPAIPDKETIDEEPKIILGQSDVSGPPPEPDVRREPTAVNVVASRFVDLVEAGVERAVAAEQSSGLPYKVLKSRKDVVAAVTRLLDTFHLEPEVRKRTREAVLNRIMLQNAESDELLNQKIALEAAKQVGADLGIHEQLTQIGVQVNLDDLKPWISESSEPEKK